jgi:hypothetical protein
MLARLTRPLKPHALDATSYRRREQALINGRV